MSTIRKIAIGLIISGVIMFFVAGSLFSYIGDVSPTIKLIGEISFVLWIPSIVLGIILLSKKKNI